MRHAHYCAERGGSKTFRVSFHHLNAKPGGLFANGRKRRRPFRGVGHVNGEGLVRLRDAPDRADEIGHGKIASAAAFAKDMSPAGKAVEELLKDPSKEAAEALLAKLDTLLPDDPAMAAVIAEEMAKG